MKRVFILVALFLSLGIVSCDDDDKNDNNNSDNKRIVGTWKCVGFGNVETNKVKPIKPQDCNKCYILRFNADGTVGGKSSTNEVQGHFEVDLKLKKLKVSMGVRTFINEYLDGDLYLETINKVTHYSLSKKDELLLYYNDKKEYLLFSLKK